MSHLLMVNHFHKELGKRRLQFSYNIKVLSKEALLEGDELFSPYCTLKNKN